MANHKWHSWLLGFQGPDMTSTRQVLANNLKFLMAGSAELGTQTRLSERSGVGQTTVGRILRNETDAGVETVESLARVFKLTASDLIDPGLIRSLSGESSNVEGTNGAVGLVPLISWVAAGMLYEAIDQLAPGDAEEWLESPFRHGNSTFCLRVSGNSMFPDYRDGEIIQVDPDVEATHGSDVVVRTPDGRATFKRLQVESDGEKFLIAVNESWPDRIIRVPDGTIICGVVTGSWMDRRKR
ncbi:SOS-response transcriptional repressor LexA (RecA-mediated autopeptidase) [Azotobacter beijerinckii]|uniref:SOS-response transcriptional repressor LexA (RecA-mediated autopeptidase) n=2 Tax=Azotobacter beijerinckii TaxID=170623 RepID=A0A1I0Z3A4_9GAMM|nr:SOS-response transcriptional repressor LexA (RecA-mediated autopeptidase) [Azotobacter beijerinckii]